AKLCVSENILLVPIPGPCALVSALSTGSGLPTNDRFSFKAFRIKKKKVHGFGRPNTYTDNVPPHKLSQFLEEASSTFGDARIEHVLGHLESTNTSPSNERRWS
ncbi:hypothetical protein PIB30_064450, partial [Stylosanthes scabra]|nr:hypothetical protein [Stylosanthes scabra]